MWKVVPCCRLGCYKFFLQIKSPRHKDMNVALESRRHLRDLRQLHPEARILSEVLSEVLIDTGSLILKENVSNVM